ncbi:MAG: signal peptide peptidase SppA [bacterium]
MSKGTRIIVILSGIIILAAFTAGILSRIKPDLFTPESIGLLRVEGVIIDVDWYIEQVHAFRDNESIKGVVLRLDTPGGAIAPTQELYSELLKLKEKKPIVTSMGTIAASGGYYLASASDWIIANPGTITGSIGVIMEFINLEELFGKIGIKSRVIKSGEHKDMGSPFRDLTEEERRLLGDMVMDTHDQFVNAVLEARPVLSDEIRPYMDGRVMTGRQAMKLELVDEMGNLPDALVKAAELAGLPEGPPEVVEPERDEGSLLTLLFGRSAGEAVRSLATQIMDIGGGQRYLQLWRAF